MTVKLYIHMHILNGPYTHNKSVKPTCTSKKSAEIEFDAN